jgi:monothiol glutaredoxin
MTDLIEKVKTALTEHDVVLFMKGTPDFPQCGFSAQVAAILKELSLDFAYVNILKNPELRRLLPEYSQWPTYPQFFVREELIGGCDIVVEAFKDGELQALIKEHQLSCQSTMTELDFGAPL